MNKPVTVRRSGHAEGHHRAAARLAQGLSAPGGRARPARAAARDHARRRRQASRRCRSTTPPAPTPITTSPSTSRRASSAHAHRMGQGARRRRGIRGPADQAGRQRQRHRQAPRAQFPEHAEAVARASTARRSRNTNWPRAGIITKEMIYVAERENLGRKTACSTARRRRSPTARASAPSVPAVRHAGIRARRDRARPRHHPVQHQPRRTRADDHRPQLPDQDQRQYRQLGRHLLGRGRSREDGVGDPLGRRHGDGPLHRPQHPQHARMDPPQLAGPDRHRADLPGAGEGRRRSGQARLGVSTRTR